MPSLTSQRQSQPITLPPTRASRIASLGVHRPERVVTNAEICERIDSDDEWIVSRSGIRERRFAERDETVVDLAIPAARDALEASGLAPEDIGLVVVATSTHMAQTPAAAPLIADRLGIRAGAVDLSAGCAGFCYALAMASDAVRVGSAEHALVIGVEKLTDTLDLEDRSTAFIFGDGAGAVVVSPSEAPGIGPVVWGSDGSQADAITQTPRLWTALRDDPDAPFPVITMAGQTVFRWAAFSMGSVARDALARAGLGPDQLDAFIPHQANLRIIEALARTLKFPDSVAIARDVEHAGNTSAASVPLAMHEMLQQKQAAPGDTALLLAFGAGLVYAGQTVTLPALTG